MVSEMEFDVGDSDSTPELVKTDTVTPVTRQLKWLFALAPSPKGGSHYRL